MSNPFSCEECRAQFASLSEANLRAQPNLAVTANAPELSAQALSHLESCAACQFEYSMLRGIVGELHALPFHAAPPELRGRIRAQIARENATSPVVAARRWFWPRFTLPRFAMPNSAPKWATLSFSGALVTACLLFLLAREPQLPLSSSAPVSDSATSSAASSNQTASDEAAKMSSGDAKKPAKTGKVLPDAKRAQSLDQNAALKQAPPAFAAPNAAAPIPGDSATLSTRNASPDAPQRATDNAEPRAPFSDSASTRNSSASSPLTQRSNALSEKTSPQNTLKNNAPDANSADANAASSSDAARFAQLELLPTTKSAKTSRTGAADSAQTPLNSTPSGGATTSSATTGFAR